MNLYTFSASIAPTAQKPRQFAAQCRAVLQFTLPNHQYFPAESNQRFHISIIAFFIPLEFL
jgi:hypothetical protein